MNWRALINLVFVALAAPVAGAATSITELTPDPCFDQPLGDFATVERACSDTIAGLESLISSTASDRQTLVGAFNNRAIVRMRLGELALAAEDLGQAMVLAPDDWPTYLNRGNLMIRMGQPQAALADFQTAQALSSRPLSVTVRNATFAYRALGDIVGAQTSLRVSANPDSGLRPPAPDTVVSPEGLPR